MVLNEPETSLHPDLLVPLATMIRAAAAVTQVVVVTHSQAMRQQLDTDGSSEIELFKEWGETLVTGQTMLTAPPWDWGKR
jgi:predicted ATPase